MRRRYMGALLAGARKRRGLTLEALANRVAKEGVDLTPAALGNYEHGIRVPRWSHLRALARALEIPASDIVRPLIEEFSELRKDDLPDAAG